MHFLLFYCRAGFEADLAREVQDKATALEIFGYPRFSANSGFITFHCYQDGDAHRFASEVPFNQLIFARQMLVACEQIEDLPTEDRLTPIIQAARTMNTCGEILVEYPDTTEGRELSRFCRKFTVVARQGLRGAGVLSQKDNPRLPCLHLFFTEGTKVILGYSLRHNHSAYPLGIMRLKFPPEAPSRSTLKLDEAIQLFIPADQQEKRLQPGMHAVDLGACPGGWTYQLVRRGLKVQAIDNGAMAENLMESGLVKHYAADGFKYKPAKKNVTWLVCDMIEQPQRVARLMAQWLADGWCKEAIFNLKLPMKRRYESVLESFAIIEEVLARHKWQLQAKHLYHDREEITVHLSLGG